MRLRMRRLIGVSALFFGLGLYGCSSQQQEEEEGLEVSGQENEENVDAEGNAENGEVEGNEESNDEGEQFSNENGEDTADAGDATENDLQEIIQEMNGQQMADTGETEMGDATALEQDASMAGNAGMGANAMASTPTDLAPMNAATAAPMNAATAAPAAPATASNPPPFQPGGSPAGQGLPEIGSKMAYIVEAGDTLGKISAKIYGTPGRWNELASLSGIANPSRIYPGDLVYYTLDESAVSFASAYESIQKTTENVQQGDTLATIAQRIYGSSKAWRSLWRHNDKIDNPDVLTVSTIYYVPKGASTAAVNKIKSNIAKVSKGSVEKSKEVVKSVAKATKSVNASVNSIGLSAAVSFNGNYAAI